MQSIEPLESRRLLSHVGLDLGFGEAGYAHVDGSVLIAPAIGGKVLAVGQSGAVRLNADGSVDSTFRDRGAPSDVPRDTQNALLRGQKLFVAGMQRKAQQDGGGFDRLFVRKVNLSTGGADSAFGDGGEISFVPTAAADNLTEFDFVGVNSMAVMPDGGLLLAIKEWMNVAGEQPWAIVLQKLTAAGQLDTSFGQGGAVKVFVTPKGEDPPAGFGRMVMQADGRFVLISGTDSAPVLLGYSADGSKDDSFGAGGGVINLPSDSYYTFGRDLILQSDGKLLLSSNNEDISGDHVTGAINRYNADGSPDTSFGNAGVVNLFHGKHEVSLGEVIVDAQGRIICDNGGELLRLMPNGTPDSSFDDDGYDQIPPRWGADYSPISLAIDVSSNILQGRESEVVRFVDRERVALASDGRLYIEGTDAADTIGAFLTGDNVVQLIVQFNAQSFSFISAKVTRFIVTAGDGNNPIDLVPDRNATVNAGAGDDSIRTGDGDDSISAGDGNDTVDAGGGKDQVFGGNGDDSLFGGGGNDKIFGEYGFDSIAGGDGNDRLYGGHTYLLQDDEYHSLEDGDDSLSGNAGNDTCYGQFGNDRVAGNGGRDKLFGGDGNDRLFGGASGDWLYGGKGADQLLGEGGRDRLYADDANDDSSPLDTLHGGAGDDLLVTRDDAVDYLFGDGGRDSCAADGNDVLTSIEVPG